MRIAMYSTSKLFGTRITGGLKRFLELYYGLSERGYIVDLYSSDSKEVLKRNNINGYSLNNINDTNRVLIPAELRIMFKNIKVIKRIKKIKYDRIIVFDVPTAFSLSVMNVKNIQLFIRQDLIGYKYISMKDRIKNKLFLAQYLRVLSFIERICLTKADKIIVQCKYDLNKLIARHNKLKNIILAKTRIQINNVNPSWIVNNSIDFEKSVEKNNDIFTIIFIGDFSSERKGQRILIDAIKLLPNNSFQLNIIGDGRQLESYIKECKEYNNIIFYGRVNNPIRIVKASDLVVVPSLADSCPNTVMEALYNEVPVIGAITGGIPEILINDNSLFQLNPTNLAKKIQELMNKESLYKLKNLQKEIKEKLSFDWVGAVIAHLEIRGLTNE